MRTTFYSLQFTGANVLTMDAPNALVWNVAAEYGAMSRHGYLADSQPQLAIDQSLFVIATRLWCNFADGLVFQYDPLNPITSFSPQIALWEGDLTAGQVTGKLPDSWLDFSYNTLNEWIPCEKKIPRNPNPSNLSHGYPLCSIYSGGSYFLTKSVNPDFNGSKVLFAFQALIATSYY